MIACSTAEATQDTNVWPSWDNPRLFLDQLRICYTGLTERADVVGYAVTNISVPATNRPNKATLENYKAAIKVLAPYFWNTNYPISNASSVVYWDDTTLAIDTEYPTNVLDWTPDRGMSGTGGYTQDTTVGHAYGFTNEYTQSGGTNFSGSRTNWYTTDYGIQPIRDMLDRLTHTISTASVGGPNDGDIGQVGEVWFLLQYDYYEGTSYSNEYQLKGWAYDSNTNVHYEPEVTLWPGLLVSRSDEPAITSIYATNNVWDNDHTKTFEFWDEATFDRPTWRYSYIVETSGTNVCSDHAGSTIVELLSYINNFAVAVGAQPTSWTNSVDILNPNYNLGVDYYTIQLYYIDGSGYTLGGHHTGEIEISDYTYVGCEINDTAEYSYILSGTISTNYNSERQLYLYGDYPNDFLAWNNPYSQVVATNIFKWQTEGRGSDLVFTNYAVIGDSFVTNSSVSTNSDFIMGTTNIQSITIPLKDTTDIETGWGVSKGVWSLNWCVTNGFTIK